MVRLTHHTNPCAILEQTGSRILNVNWPSYQIQDQFNLTYFIYAPNIQREN